MTRGLYFLQSCSCPQWNFPFKLSVTIWQITSLSFVNKGLNFWLNASPTTTTSLFFIEYWVFLLSLLCLFYTNEEKIVFSCFLELIKGKVTSQATFLFNKNVKYVKFRVDNSSKRTLSKKEEKTLFLFWEFFVWFWATTTCLSSVRYRFLPLVV